MAQFTVSAQLPLELVTLLPESLSIIRMVLAETSPPATRMGVTQTLFCPGVMMVTAPSWRLLKVSSVGSEATLAEITLPTWPRS